MKKRRQRGIHHVVRICIGLGLLISSLISFLFYQNDSAKINLNFEREIDGYATSIEEQVHDQVAILRALKGLFNASEEVSRAEFQIFASNLLPNYPAIQAVAWIPRVSAKQRGNLEIQAQQDGFEWFQITDRKEQGEMVRAPPRNEYYPLYYIEPLKGNEAALSFDVASNSTRSKSLFTARDTGLPRATSRIMLVQETAQEWSVQFLLPIYKGSSTTISERRESMIGALGGVFRFQDLMHETEVDKAANGMIEMELLDVRSDEEGDVLYQSNLVEGKLDSAYQYIKSLSPEGGCQWKLVATPSSAYISTQRSNTPIISFIIGLLVTGWISAYLDRVAREKKLVEQQVVRRTRQLQTQSKSLAHSNTLLKQEIVERKLLQQRITEVTDHEQRRLGEELHDSLGQQVAVIVLLGQRMQELLKAAPQPVLKLLERLTKSAQISQAQIRALSKGLLPLEVERWGLKTALEHLVESIKGISDVTVGFNNEGDCAVKDSAVAMHLYRIAQEALRNSLEHGEASQVTLSLSCIETGTVLTIKDNGKGFNMAALKSPGSGLSSMRHRADLMGAALNFESPEGGGSSVICSLSQENRIDENR